jgi:ABC-type transport system substrate-binding protein
MKGIAYSALVTLMLLVLFIPMVSGQNGPLIDVLRYVVIQGNPAQLVAMQAGAVDVLTQRTRQSDVETLGAAGFTVTQNLGFHVCFIGFNIRADQSYRRPEVTFWPLADVDFRHAMMHSFDQIGILSSIYGMIATPIPSLVPPAMGMYYAPDVMTHPFNLGDPFTSPAGEHSTCGILKDAGYAFVDADHSGTVTWEDYWVMPNGDPLPEMEVLAPTGQVEFEKHYLVLKWLTDLAEIGLQGTWINNYIGFTQANQGMGYELWDYANMVYNGADFDAFIMDFQLNKLPDHLYSWLHSSQDSQLSPGRFNAFGLNNATLDELLETVKFSLNINDVADAAKEVQRRLADPANLQAVPFIPAFSMNYFDVYDPNLRGIVKSPGFGTGNGGYVGLKEPAGPIPSVWTYTNIRWAPGTERFEGGKTVSVWCLSDTPETLNPLYAGTTSAWEIMDRLHDPLVTPNPYNHNDYGWIAWDWTIKQTVDGMEIDFTLRNDVFWQDGYQLTAYDVETCLELIKSYQVPRYADAWESLVDVVVTGYLDFTIFCNKASLPLFYDYANLAALLPPQIWNRSWGSLAALLAYDPTAYAYGSDMAPGYSAGPWADQVPTNLLGTGPFIFQFYNPTNQYADMWANKHYFMSQAAIASLKAQMFWEVGDYTASTTKPGLPNDGKVNVIDLTFTCFAFGTIKGLDPNYDAAADFNSNNAVMIEDLSNCAYHLLWQKEYP